MSVVFDFNNSLNDVVPDSPTLFPFDMKMNEKSDLLRCVFLLSSQVRSSFVSVVFDFNASLNDVAPVLPITLPVDEKRMKRVNC